jgi:hypothetical protein
VGFESLISKAEQFSEGMVEANCKRQLSDVHLFKLKKVLENIRNGSKQFAK